MPRKKCGMGKLIDLTGQRFGRLTVIERLESRAGQSLWLCQCSCGKSTAVEGKDLRRGKSKSCGCLRGETTGIRFQTHGATKNDKHNPDYRLYAIWRGMVFRCENKNCESYARYGGNGIAVCPEWKNSFEVFRCWAISSGYTDGLSIDRLDNTKGYSPENCRWSTPLQQTQNRRITRWLTYKGHTKTLKEWADKYGLTYHTLKGRLYRGWSIERALTEPVKKKK